MESKKEVIVIAWLGAAITGALGIASAAWGNSQRKKEAEKARQHERDMQERQREQQMRTWNETNYAEQKAQMKKAGLNPGLMYGMGGAGGATTGSTQGGSGVQAGIENMPVPDAIGMGLMNAQKKNIEAQTEVAKADAEKKQVETAKIGGVDTEQSKESTRGMKIVNDLNEAVQSARWNKEQAEADMQQILSERMNAEWETYKSVAYGNKEVTNANSLAGQVVKAGLLKVMEELNAIKAGINATNKNAKLTEVRTTIERYKEKLAKEGINPESNGVIKLTYDMIEWFRNVPENPNL